MAAPDGVNAVAYGANNGTNYANGGSGFWGTSAAAPHVAGMAATVWEAVPGYSVTQLRDYIQSRATYKANEGTCGGSLAAAGASPESGMQNNRFGWGRINLNAPTAVTMADFSAAQTGDAVLLRWETASELNNRGFNLYRGTDPSAPDRQLNETLIPSQSPGNPGGFIHTWEDRADLAPGTTYFYWVEDVDMNGAATRHGPVSVDYSVPTAVRVLDASAVTTLPLALPLISAGLLALAGLALAGRRRR